MKHEAIAMLSQCWCHIFVSSRAQRQITRQWCKIDFWLKRKINLVHKKCYMKTPRDTNCSRPDTRQRETGAMRAREHRWTNQGWDTTRRRWRWYNGRSGSEPRGRNFLFYKIKQEVKMRKDKTDWTQRNKSVDTVVTCKHAYWCALFPIQNYDNVVM